MDKLETLEVSGTPEDIGFTIGQADADSIQKQVLQLSEFRETERTWQDSSYLKMLDAAARSVFPEYVLELEGMARDAQVEYETLLIFHCPMTQFRNPRNILRKVAHPSFILQQKVLLQ